MVAVGWGGQPVAGTAALAPAPVGDSGPPEETFLGGPQGLKGCQREAHLSVPAGKATSSTHCSRHRQFVGASCA